MHSHCRFTFHDVMYSHNTTHNTNDYAFTLHNTHITNVTGSLTSHNITTSRSCILTLLCYTLTTSKSVFTPLSYIITTSKSVFTLLCTYMGFMGSMYPSYSTNLSTHFLFPRLSGLDNHKIASPFAFWQLWRCLMVWH